MDLSKFIRSKLDQFKQSVIDAASVPAPTQTQTQKFNPLSLTPNLSNIISPPKPVQFQPLNLTPTLSSVMQPPRFNQSILQQPKPIQLTPPKPIQLTPPKPVQFNPISLTPTLSNVINPPTLPTPIKQVDELGDAYKNFKKVRDVNLRVIGRGIQEQALPTAAFFAGGAVAAPFGLAGGPLSPITVPAAYIVGGLVSSYGTSYIQNVIANSIVSPEKMRQYQEQKIREEKENPVAAFIGETIPSLAFLKPSLSTLKSATNLAKNIINRKIPIKELTNPIYRKGVLDLINVTVGATSQVGLEAIKQYRQGEFNPVLLLSRFVVGTTLNKPTEFGEKLLSPLSNWQEVNKSVTRVFTPDEFQKGAENLSPDRAKELNKIAEIAIKNNTNIQFTANISQRSPLAKFFRLPIGTKGSYYIKFVSKEPIPKTRNLPALLAPQVNTSLSPIAPVAPTSQVAPIAPLAPISPVAPTPQVAPIAPVAPTPPLAPTSPVAPIAPVVSLTPPVAPTTPVVPLTPPMELQTAPTVLKIGLQDYKLSFTNDVDKSLFVLSQLPPQSIARTGYIEYLKQVFPDSTPSQIEALSNLLRREIINTSKVNKAGKSIKVPNFSKNYTTTKPSAPLKVAQLRVKKGKLIVPEEVKTKSPFPQQPVVRGGVEDLSRVLRGTKGRTADDIMKIHPDIQLKRDVPATDVYGNKVTIPDGEKLTPYELKGNKILLQDGQTYIVSKNQFENIKGNSVGGEAKPFAPELQGTEETVKGTVGTNAELKRLGYSVEKDMGGDVSITKGGRDISFNELPPQIQKLVQGAGDATPTKFSQYQLPDGKNYKEVLIKAPRVTNAELSFDKWLKDNNIPPRETWDTGQRNNIQKAYQEYEDSFMRSNNFKSSHWDEPNVISHLRLNERTYKGKKVTFMEELQSDWAREGRSKGFADPLAKPKTFSAAEINRLRELRVQQGFRQLTAAETAEMNQLATKSNEVTKGVPSGIPNNPLLKNWQELSVKRALKEAVDNNSEYFSWINGEQTSARYNLATHVDNVGWNKEYQGLGKDIHIDAKDGKKIIVGINKDGLVENRAGTVNVPSDWQGKSLDEVIGKGLADKIMAEETGTLSGEGLKFGGEWANNLYDKQVKNIVEDVTGGKVEMLDLGLPIGDKAPVWKAVDKDGYTIGQALKANDLKVGKPVSNGNAPYIITDILGDGKFKAVPKSHIDAVINDKRYTTNKTIPEAIKYLKKVAPNGMESFDISTKKSAGQQAIKITPEIRAMVRGEAPTFKASGKQFEDVQLKAQSPLPQPTTQTTGLYDTGKIVTETPSAPKSSQQKTKLKLSAMESPEEIFNERNKNITEGYRKGEDAQRALLEEKKNIKESLFYAIKVLFNSINQRAYDLANKALKEGKGIVDQLNPKYFLPELQYSSSYIKNLLEDNFTPAYKLANTIPDGWDEVGKIVQMERIINERQDVANPGADTPKKAQDFLTEQEKRFTPEEYKILRDSVDLFRNGVQVFNDYIAKSGFRTPEFIKKANENQYYAAFQNLDYINEKLTSKIYKVTGSLQDIANPATSTIAKVIVTAKAVEYNNSRISMTKFLEEYTDLKPIPAKKYFNGKENIFIEPKDPKLGLVTFVKDGEFDGVYMDKESALILNKTDNETINRAARVARILTLAPIYRNIFTVLNIAYQLVSNPERDIRRLYANLPRLKGTPLILSPVIDAARIIRGYFTAVIPSLKRTLRIPDATVKELEKLRAIGLITDNLDGGKTDNDTEIERIFQGAGIEMRKQKLEIKRTLNILHDTVKSIGNFFEGLPKIAAYNELKGTMSDQQLGNFIRNKAGSPNFREQGTLTPVTNSILLFSNAFKENMKEDFETATGKQSRASFWLKMLILNSPVFYTIATAYGLYGEDKRKELENVPEYEKTNYDIVTHGLDKNGKTIYTIGVKDEFSKLFSGIIWKLSKKNKDIKEIMDVIDFTRGVIPSSTPSFNMYSDIFQYVSGRNPWDNYRQRNAIDEEIFDAGVRRSFVPFINYLAKSQGASSFLPSIDLTDSATELEKKLNFPVIGNIMKKVIRVSDYGQVEEDRKLEEKITSERAAINKDEEEAVTNALKIYKSDIGNKDTIVDNLIKSQIGEIDTQEKKTRAQNLVKEFEVATIVGKNDTMVNSIINSPSNQATVEILKRLKVNKGADFDEFYKNLIEQKVISADVVRLFSETQGAPKTSSTNKYIPIRDVNGEYKLIQTDRAIYTPKLSGIASLDKLELAKQADSYTNKINDIQALYQAGKKSSFDASNQIEILQALQKDIRARIKSTKPKKIKIGSLKKVKAPKFKKIKIPKVKVIKVAKPKRLNIKNIRNFRSQ